MTRYRGARPGTAEATRLALPGPWAGQALCAMPTPTPGSRPRASTLWPGPPYASAGPTRSAPSAWTTHCPARTPGPKSRPESGLAPTPQERNKLWQQRKAVAA
jgi:hypothetical protein